MTPQILTHCGELMIVPLIGNILELPDDQGEYSWNKGRELPREMYAECDKNLPLSVSLYQNFSWESCSLLSRIFFHIQRSMKLK